MSQSAEPHICPSDDLLLRLVYEELDREVSAFVSSHIVACLSCQTRTEDVRLVREAYDDVPAPRLRHDAQSLVDNAIEATGRQTVQLHGRRRSVGVWVAAAAVVISFVGGAIANRLTATVGVNDAGGVQAELLEASLQVPLAGVRLEALTSAEYFVAQDSALARVFLTTLVSDPSPHVRLRAVEGLHGVPLGREALVVVARRLAEEPVTSLRLALIDLLVDQQANTDVGTLRQLADSDRNPSVRRRAAQALAQMNEAS